MVGVEGEGWGQSAQHSYLWPVARGNQGNTQWLGWPGPHLQISPGRLPPPLKVPWWSRPRPHPTQWRSPQETCRRLPPSLAAGCTLKEERGEVTAGGVATAGGEVHLYFIF